jgi:hypothetical protein
VRRPLPLPPSGTRGERRTVPSMKDSISCEGCGTEVEVDRSLGVSTLSEPRSSNAPGRAAIIEGNVVIHQCSEGTYSPPDE